jgi:hypothetical protein
MSELSNFQKEIGEWGDKTFNSQRKHQPEDCAKGILNHLHKEYIELCRDLNGEEAADCFILLLHFAHLKGFDLLGEARKKMEINYKRIWGKPDAFGIIEHVPI